MKKFFLLALCLLGFVSVQAQTSPYKGSEAAAGDFFIYNVATGYWLQNNNRVGDWNSQVQVDTQGFDWELISLGDDTWQLNPKFANNHSLNSGDANGYLDTGQPVSAWTLTPANDGNNGYMISSNGTTLGVNPETKLLTKDGWGATTDLILIRLVLAGNESHGCGKSREQEETVEYSFHNYNNV